MWSQGDGGPSDEPAPDGGTGYYFIGRTGQLYRADEIAKDEELNGMHEALWELSERLEGLEHRTLAEYLQGQGIGERAWALAQAGYGNTSGGTLEEIGLATMVGCERAWLKDSDEGDFRWANSWGPLMKWLQEGLDIRTGWEVASVETAEDGSGPVKITSRDGRTLEGEAVVITVPLPVLQQERIHFNPPLSRGKQAAIQSMRFANGMKTVLQFNRRCWPADCHGVVCADEFFPEMWMNTNLGVGGWEPAEAARSDEPELYTVTAFAMGPFLERIMEHDAPTIMMRAVCQLERMFHMGASEPGALQAGVVYDWASHHPHIGGAYTVPSATETDPSLFALLREEVGEEASMGVSLPARRLLALPHAGGRVLFAGEATSGAYEEEDSPMTVHGSMVTGGRAAREVAAGLGWSPPAAEM